MPPAVGVPDERCGAVAVVGERHARWHACPVLRDRRSWVAGGGHRERPGSADGERGGVGAGDRRGPVDRDGRGGGAVVQGGAARGRVRWCSGSCRTCWSTPELRLDDAVASGGAAGQRVAEAHRQAGEGVEVRGADRRAERVLGQRGSDGRGGVRPDDGRRAGAVAVSTSRGDDRRRSGHAVAPGRARAGVAAPPVVGGVRRPRRSRTRPARSSPVLPVNRL